MNLHQLQTGDMISLGRYPQGANGEIQPIQWQVLEVKEGRALLLSRHVLDMQPFHAEAGVVSWFRSDLRRWLRESFLPAAFSADELTHICRPESADTADDDLLWQLFGAEDTTDTIHDSIFLLSQADILRYFPGGDGLFCPGASASMTAWVKAKHPDVDEMAGNVCWWLRTSMNQNPFSMIVSPVDSMGMSMIDPDNLQGVRPAMWVEMD